jgi:hypothetical protein
VVFTTLIIRGRPGDSRAAPPLLLLLLLLLLLFPAPQLLIEQNAQLLSVRKIIFSKPNGRGRILLLHVVRSSLSLIVTGRRVSLALVADGKLQSREQLYAQIMHPIEHIKTEARCSVHYRRQQRLLPLGCVVAECSPYGRVRLMLCCVTFACQRLATAPADMYMSFMSWGIAKVAMERVTRGRVKRVQVRLQRRALRRFGALPCDC